MKLSVDLDEHIESPPDKVWKALTDSTMLARWLMPNDVEPSSVAQDQYSLACAVSPRIGWQGCRADPSRPGRLQA